MAETPHPRHSGLVRVTHWLITFAFLALLVTGLEIVVSHLLGRDRQRQHCSSFQNPHPILQKHGPHRLRLRPSGPERLEPLSPFPICVGVSARRFAIWCRKSLERALPPEFASFSL